MENAKAIYELNTEYPNGPNGMPTTYKYYPFVHGGIFKYSNSTAGWYVFIATSYKITNDNILYRK